MLLHICPEKKGGLESPAFCYFYFLVRGAICAGLSLSGGNGVADEIQIQAYFAGCHAETFPSSWDGSAGIFFFLIASAHARVQQLFTGDPSTSLAYRSHSPLSKDSEGWDHQSSGGNRAAMAEMEWEQI